MKKILFAGFLACLVILSAGCPPKEAPPIPHDFKISGPIQDVLVLPRIDCLLNPCPLATAFTVKTADNKTHMVALRGDRTAEVQSGAKIELVYNDLWLVAKNWITVTDEKGYKSDIQVFYYATTQYKILAPNPSNAPKQVP